MPHSRVDTVKMPVDQIITVLRPKRAVSQPVIGIAIAVARMLNVIVQEISSGVAEKLPCICGRTVEATRIELKYNATASIAEMRISTRRDTLICASAASCSVVSAICFLLPASGKMSACEPGPVHAA